MIVAIEGLITHKEPTFVHVSLTNGLSYGVFVSFFTSSALEINAKAKLFITQIIREDANLLYGFLSKSEQNMFASLIKVNGIGSSTAMAVCSTLSAEDFSQALLCGNIDALKKVPGIGPKTAKRILVELSEFTSNIEQTNVEYQNAFAALESLGFKADKIRQVLKDCSGSTQELITQALKIIK